MGIKDKILRIKEGLPYKTYKISCRVWSKPAWIMKISDIFRIRISLEKNQDYWSDKIYSKFEKVLTGKIRSVPFCAFKKILLLYKITKQTVIFIIGACSKIKFVWVITRNLIIRECYCP